jgi:hypothetical protein
MSQTLRGLHVSATTESDFQIRDETFQDARNNLDHAFEESWEHCNDDVRDKIRLTQAAIARAQNAPGWIQAYLGIHSAAATKSIPLIQQRIQQLEAPPLPPGPLDENFRLKMDLLMGREDSFTSFMRRRGLSLPRPGDELKQARNELVNMQAFTKYWKQGD